MDKYHLNENIKSNLGLNACSKISSCIESALNTRLEESFKQYFKATITFLSYDPEK